MLKDIGLLALRVGAGTTLMAHGAPKLFGGPGKKPLAISEKIFGPNYAGSLESLGIDNFAAGLASMGVPSPKAAAVASALAEFGGGLALALGCKTRLAGLIVATNMGVAVYKAHWANGLVGQGGYELAASLGTAAATLTLTGPGSISLDRLLGGSAD